MRSVYYKSFVCFIASMILPGLVAHAQNSLQATHSVVIATYQYADNPRIKNLKPFAQYFSSLTGIKTEVKSYPNVKALLLAMEQEEVDVAFLNTFGYLLAKEKSAAYEVGAVLSIPPHRENAYKSVLVVGRNVPENTLEEVVASASDFILVLVSEGSTSGNLVPRLKLASLQPGYPERFFLEVQYANDHKLALQRALQGEFALCAFGRDEYDKLGADTVRLKKLWESPAIPLGPVVYRKALPESVRDELQKALLHLHEQNPEALESIKAGWTEALTADRYMEAKEEYYESLLQLSPNREVALLIIRNFAR